MKDYNGKDGIAFQEIYCCDLFVQCGFDKLGFKIGWSRIANKTNDKENLNYYDVSF